MKAPKGQIGSKKISKEKKKLISGSGSTDKNTHICPGKELSLLYESFYSKNKCSRYLNSKLV